MRFVPYALSMALLVAQQMSAQHSAASPAVDSLQDIKRIFVGQLIGAQGDQLRELIIASLDSTKLFVITENQDRADAILKGAADDHAFVDTYDSSEGINVRENGGKSSGGTYAKTSGAYGGLGISDSQSLHTKERKHEAYAAVRLCNKDGDVLWSTTQESLGAKFRGASADVASKIARQLTIDMEKARRVGSEK